MTEIGKHTKSVPTIRERDIIPFGKYKGKVLLEVYAQDPDYVEWLIHNVTNYSIDLYSGWKEILDVNDIVPEDGIYVIACRGDMHLIFEIYNLKKGDRFWDLYEGENSHCNGWAIVDCLAYHYIPEYSINNSYWVNEMNQRYVDEYGHEHNFGLITIAVINKEALVYILPNWNINISLSKLNELDDCNPVIEGMLGGLWEGAYTNTKSKDGIEYTFADIKGFLHIPAYTEELHSKHWNLAEQITNK